MTKCPQASLVAHSVKSLLKSMVRILTAEPGVSSISMILVFRVASRCVIPQPLRSPYWFGESEVSACSLLSRTDSMSLENTLVLQMFLSSSTASGFVFFGITETSSFFQIEGHCWPFKMARNISVMGHSELANVAASNWTGGSMETVVLGSLYFETSPMVSTLF